MRVESGQLRQWRTEAVRHGYSDGTDIFLVLQRDPDFKNDPFWRVLKSEGGTKLLSETRIERWSEVLGGDG
jgi:hypothetical protein